MLNWQSTCNFLCVELRFSIEKYYQLALFMLIMGVQFPLQKLSTLQVLEATMDQMFRDFWLLVELEMVYNHILLK